MHIIGIGGWLAMIINLPFHTWSISTWASSMVCSVAISVEISALIVYLLYRFNYAFMKFEQFLHHLLLWYLPCVLDKNLPVGEGGEVQIAYVGG